MKKIYEHRSTKNPPWNPMCLFAPICIVFVHVIAHESVPILYCSYRAPTTGTCITLLNEKREK